MLNEITKAQLLVLQLGRRKMPGRCGAQKISLAR